MAAVITAQAQEAVGQSAAFDEGVDLGHCAGTRGALAGKAEFLKV